MIETSCAPPPCAVCGPAEGAGNARISGASFGVDGMICRRCYDRRIRHKRQAAPCDLCGGEGPRKTAFHLPYRYRAEPFGLMGRVCLTCRNELIEEFKAEGLSWTGWSHRNDVGEVSRASRAEQALPVVALCQHARPVRAGFRLDDLTPAAMSRLVRHLARQGRAWTLALAGVG